MRCSQCGYHSFDGLKNCKKCGSSLSCKSESVVSRSHDLNVVEQPSLPLSLPDRAPMGDASQGGSPSPTKKERVFPSFLQSRDHEGNFLTGIDEPSSPKSCAVAPVLEDAPHYILRRIVATICDVLILAIVWLAFVAVGAWGLEQPARDFLQLLFVNMPLRVSYYLIFILSLLSYFTLLHSAGQTLGKMIVKLSVVNKQGEPPSLVEGIFRTVGGMLSLLCGGWGYFRVLFDSEQRGWNDRIAGTRVELHQDNLIEHAGVLACETECDEVG